VRVLITMPKGLAVSLGREEQARLRVRLLEADPAELKLKIEHEPGNQVETTHLSIARSAESKLQAY